MASKHLKKELNHTRETQMETTMRYHYKPNRMGQNITKYNHFGKLASSTKIVLFAYIYIHTQQQKCITLFTIRLAQESL